MRPKLHEYVEYLSETQKPDVIMEYMANDFQKTLKYAALTNRQPKLGDFVPCDEDGNVLDRTSIEFETGKVTGTDLKEWIAADNRVIFSGDWEVVTSNEFITRIHSKTTNITIDFDSIRIGLVRTDKSGFVLERSYPDRIEDLPREIEFKEGVI